MTLVALILIAIDIALFILLAFMNNELDSIYNSYQMFKKEMIEKNHIVKVKNFNYIL